MIRLALADDHELLLDGLAAALADAPDITLVGRAPDGLAALRLLRDERPDVAVLDLHMPLRSGMDVLRAAAHEGLGARVILVTSFDDDASYREALAAGARGFLGKTAGVKRLIEAVRTVARGETYFESGIGERARGAGPSPQRGPRDNPLTPREREILRLIATGLSNGEIAEQLGTAEGTVKNQTSSILMKLGVRDRTRAVLAALRDGWI